MKSRLASSGALAGSLLLAACASPLHHPANPQDPLEPINRAVFNFNDAIDRTALKPAATAYKNVVPGVVQVGVNNFFGNLADVWSGVNNLAQAKGQDGLSDLTRVAINSTFGIFGLLDIATPAGLRKHSEDLGQTLGYWGVPSGPYLMLPIFGPSTIRDAAALPVDLWGDPWSHKDPVRWRNVGIGVRAIDQRASILDASNLLEDAALDRYEFIRDGYLQRRASKIYDDERSQERHEKQLQKQRQGGAQEDDDTPSGKVDMKKAYGDDADDAPSGKVDMKKAYGDDDAGPAPAAAPVPPPSSGKEQK